MPGKKRILLVEDELGIQAILRKRLESKGYEVIAAGDGETGLSLARTEKPDLILLDVMLPRRDGYSVCRLLKFDNRYRHIPVIMLTARSQERDRETGRHTGADAYITKPFESAELLATIAGLLGDPPQGGSRAPGES
jgi:DNA-binding response OmpR family regulator